MYIPLANQLRIKDSSNVTFSLPMSITDALENTIELYGERIDGRNLLRQVLLQIHRFCPSEITQASLIDYEVKRQAEKLVLLGQDIPTLFTSPGLASIKLQCSRLDLVDSSTAELLHRKHHYLGSSRGDAIHLGLYYDEGVSPKPRLMSIVSLSPFDLMHIVDALPDGLRHEQVLVLSRLFAFDWCPRNTISYTLGRVFNWLYTQRPHVKMLMTYLNPNLGFSGSVYKATNWTLFGREKKKRYLYLDSNYITDRQMIRTYGTADLQKLGLILGNRVLGSTLPLKPLEVYAYFLDDALRIKYGHGFNYEFQPAAALVGGG